MIPFAFKMELQSHPSLLGSKMEVTKYSVSRNRITSGLLFIIPFEYLVEIIPDSSRNMILWHISVHISSIEIPF